MAPFQWPPSPSVEDEDVALAKEHLLDVSRCRLNSDDQGAQSRGSVDQFPIILDTSDSAGLISPEVPRSSNPCSLIPDNSSGDEQQEPTTPPALNHDKRFVFLPSRKSDIDETSPHDGLHRSKSTARIPPFQEVPRGRPQVTRLQTDLGAGLDTMISGHRRTPSPYAYKPGALVDSSTARQNNANLLSPTHVRGARRPLSARPASYCHNHESSDSDHRAKSRKRLERSRGRAVPPTLAHSESEIAGMKSSGSRI